MKIALISDIHAEFYKNEPDWLPPLPENPDVLVLAGDIHIGKLLIPFIERVSKALPRTCLVVIAGNHEFYRQYRLSTLNAYREAFVEHTRIHF
ncbi:metallophosphoesterase [Cellvibrio sp. BR]|uniref:metallophosphoesterase n=1 Tax=Cellvibrio sp. BR TaxID=1134474 RepID=UPI000260096A|nr:metallophosphoesterase [Cellvibrio sp. BR]EIK43190.1 metallophosphoesterase [Cellvibrio sp. BR]